jgi:hypothetical protein
MVRNKTPFLFDLDGTPIDSVYQHPRAHGTTADPARGGLQGTGGQRAAI